MGLETIHPDVLLALNKQMTLAADFERAASISCVPMRSAFLAPSSCSARRSSMSREGLLWTPTVGRIRLRGRRGVLRRRHPHARPATGRWKAACKKWVIFSRPASPLWRRRLEFGIGLQRGRVLVDLWDIEKLFDCPRCGPARAARLREMNQTQTIPSIHPLRLSGTRPDPGRGWRRPLPSGISAKNVSMRAFTSSSVSFLLGAVFLRVLPRRPCCFQFVQPGLSFSATPESQGTEPLSLATDRS